VDITAPLEQRAIGGLGIHMMRKLMEEVEYRREGERNIVTMIKKRI
jgi:anti-sigma regulatory factor (Ser/Thr protein kinase)